MPISFKLYRLTAITVTVRCMPKKKVTARIKLNKRFEAAGVRLLAPLERAVCSTGNFPNRI